MHIITRELNLENKIVYKLAEKKTNPMKNGQRTHIGK